MVEAISTNRRFTIRLVAGIGSQKKGMYLKKVAFARQTNMNNMIRNI